MTDIFQDLPFEGYPLEDLVSSLEKKYNLRKKQVEFLFQRPRFPTNKACAEYLGIKPGTIVGWRTPVVSNGQLRDFGAAFTEYQQRFPEVAAQMMRSIYPKAVARTNELLDATKMINTKTGLIEVPDFSARAEGIKIVLGHEGKLNQGTDFTNVMNEFADFIRLKKLELSMSPIVLIPPKGIDNTSNA